VWFSLEVSDVYKESYKPFTQVLAVHSNVFSADYINVSMLANVGDSELKTHVELVLGSIIRLRPEDVVSHLKIFYGVYEFMECITRQVDLGLIFLRIPYDRANLLLELIIEAAQSFEVKTYLLAYSTTNNLSTLLLRRTQHRDKEEVVISYLNNCQDQLRRLMKVLFSLIVQAKAQHYSSIAPGLFGLITLFQAEFAALQQEFLTTHPNRGLVEEAVRQLWNGVSVVASLAVDAREKNYYQGRLFTSNVQRLVEVLKLDKS
jgi:hypothetical protein